MTDAVLIAVLGSGALSALISGVFNLVSAKMKKNVQDKIQCEAIQGAVRQLLYDRAKYLCKAHLERGYIASNDLEDLLKIHKNYHDLGGNGYLNDLMEAVSKLKIIPVLPDELKNVDKKDL